MEKVESINFEPLLNESNSSINYGKEANLRKINEVVLKNRRFIIELFNFLESLRPFYIKPLGKFTIGVSSREYQNIQNEGGSEGDFNGEEW